MCVAAWIGGEGECDGDHESTWRSPDDKLGTKVSIVSMSVAKSFQRRPRVVTCGRFRLKSRHDVFAR